MNDSAKMKKKETTSQVPDTSTTILRDVADSQHARWAVFYSRYRPMMQSYLRARFPSVDADDVIQETFIALAKLLPDYTYNPKKKGSFHNFLTGVLRNKALCALDSRNRKMAIEDRMKIEIAVGGKSVREQTYEDWREEVFETALQQLLSDNSIHDRTKQVFIRTVIRGESSDAVAESLGVPRNTVNKMKSRMFATLRNLVEKLKKVC